MTNNMYVCICMSMYVCLYLISILVRGSFVRSLPRLRYVCCVRSRWFTGWLRLVALRLPRSLVTTTTFAFTLVGYVRWFLVLLRLPLVRFVGWLPAVGYFTFYTTGSLPRHAPRRILPAHHGYFTVHAHRTRLVGWLRSRSQFFGSFFALLPRSFFYFGSVTFCLRRARTRSLSPPDSRLPCTPSLTHC